MDAPDQLRVSFPAEKGFGRIGRVAVAGLALRLGFDVATVERLRLAVDAAIEELTGPGRITVVAAWNPSALSLELANPEVALGQEEQRQAERRLAEWVGEPRVEASRLHLVVPAA